MKMLLGAVVALLLVVTPLTAQLKSRQFTNPTVPSRRALDRVNLNVAWSAHLPVQGRRDGIFSVQLVGKQILVQTVSGVITALDADTGVTEWRTRVGLPYRVSRPLGYNRKSVFAVRGHFLFSIDRVTGHTEWKYVMPDGAATAPVADNEAVYLVLGTARIYAYLFPDLKEWRRKNKEKEKRMETTPERKPSLGLYGGSSGISIENLAELRRNLGPEPERAWQYLFEAGAVQSAPVQTTEALALATSNGYFFIVSKFAPRELFRFKTENRITAPPGQHGEDAYFAGEDFVLYAVNLPSQRFHWRFTAGGPIRQQPAVTDKSVFIVADGLGMFRINRATGKEVWRSRAARRFLATNDKFVYAFDRVGNLLVLDHDRGTTLGKLGTRDFVFPIANEWSDRLFLASHNGLLVCLRDHNLKSPLVNKTVQEKEGRGFKPKENADGKKPKEEKKPKDMEDEDNGDKKDDKKAEKKKDKKDKKDD